MSNRFRVAFREKLCAGNPCTCFLCCCCCCWERWRDYYQARRISSSASSSHRTPRGPAAAAPVAAAPSPPMPSPPAATVRPHQPFLSHSDEKRHDPFDPRPRFSSDPNFSMKLGGRCKGSSTDSGEFQLAREQSSCNGDCVSCSSLKPPKVRLFSTSGGYSRTSTSGGPASIYEESRM